MKYNVNDVISNLIPNIIKCKKSNTYPVISALGSGDVATSPSKDLVG